MTQHNTATSDSFCVAFQRLLYELGKYQNFNIPSSNQRPHASHIRWRSFLIIIELSQFCGKQFHSSIMAVHFFHPVGEANTSSCPRARQEGWIVALNFICISLSLQLWKTHSELHKRCRAWVCFSYLVLAMPYACTHQTYKSCIIWSHNLSSCIASLLWAKAHPLSDLHHPNNTQIIACDYITQPM